MADFSLPWGDDLAISPSGGILLIDGDVLARERVIRRLCSNPRTVLDDGTVLDPDHLLHPAFGAGLGRVVGRSVSLAGRADLDEIETAIRNTLRAEPSVSQEQPPQITLIVVHGGVRAVIAYTSATTGQPIALPALLVQS